MDFSWMKTGSSLQSTTGVSKKEQIQILSLIMTFMEYSLRNALVYSQQCNRNGVTERDIEYGMKYEVFKFLERDNTEISQKAEEYLNDIVNCSDSDSDDESESDFDMNLLSPDEINPFTRYTDTKSDLCININKAYDNWHNWIPETPFEVCLRDSINKTFSELDEDDYSDSSM